MLPRDAELLAGELELLFLEVLGEARLQLRLEAGLGARLQEREANHMALWGKAQSFEISVQHAVSELESEQTF